MSKVALILEQLGANKTAVVKILRSCFDIEIWKIVESAGSGNPVLVRILFDRAEPTLAETLLPVLERFEHIGAGYRAYELLDHQEYSEMDASKLWRIDSTRLRNRIAARNHSMQEYTER